MTAFPLSRSIRITVGIYINIIFCPPALHRACPPRPRSLPVLSCPCVCWPPPPVDGTAHARHPAPPLETDHKPTQIDTTRNQFIHFNWVQYRASGTVWPIPLSSFRLDSFRRKVSDFHMEIEPLPAACVVAAVPWPLRRRGGPGLASTGGDTNNSSISMAPPHVFTMCILNIFHVPFDIFEGIVYGSAGCHLCGPPTCWSMDSRRAWFSRCNARNASSWRTQAA